MHPPAYKHRTEMQSFAESLRNMHSRQASDCGHWKAGLSLPEPNPVPRHPNKKQSASCSFLSNKPKHTTRNNRQPKPLYGYHINDWSSVGLCVSAIHRLHRHESDWHYATFPTKLLRQWLHEELHQTTSHTVTPIWAESVSPCFRDKPESPHSSEDWSYAKIQ